LAFSFVRVRKVVSHIKGRLRTVLRDEVMRFWGEQHNEELHNMCSSPNVTRMMKSRVYGQDM
jgi:hypothetical protein